MIEVWRKANGDLPARKLKGGFETKHEAESWVITALSQEAICGQGKCFVGAYTKGVRQIEFRGSEEEKSDVGARDNRASADECVTA